MAASERGGITIRWPAVARGAAFALVIAVVAIVANEVIDAIGDVDAGSNVVLLFYMVVVAALVLGGRRAGKLAPDAPLSHGALAGLCAYGALAVATTAVHVAQGEGVDIVAVVFNALMAIGAGILGGMVASRRPHATGSEADGPG